MGRLRDIALGFDWQKNPNRVRLEMLSEDRRIAALEAENARLRDAITDIRAHCKNDGLPNEIVLDRVIERIEEVADTVMEDQP